MEYFFSTNYNNKLVALLMKHSIPSGIATNIVLPFTFILILSSYIHLRIIVLYIFLNILFLTIRFVLKNKTLKYINNDKNNDNKDKVKAMVFTYIILLLFNGLLLSTVVLYAVLYAKQNEVIVILFIIIGIVGGALGTLNYIFHAYLVFILSLLLSLFAITFFMSAQDFFKYNFSLLFYILFMLNVAYKGYKDRVKLVMIQDSLEERIHLEVLKNREKEKQLFEQSKMAQMGEMLSMIAHQWRQPLSSINASILGIRMKLQNQKYNFSDPQKINDFLVLINSKHDKILEYTKYLSKTINVFRSFFKADKEKKKESLSNIIEDSLELITASLKNNEISIIKELKVNKRIFIYKNELIQVILNILKNSKDNFIEKNIKNRKIRILTDIIDNNYVISISDNGGGIPEDIIKKIFEPYFSTKDEKNGTGLGLYMSKMIIEEHHNGKLIAKNIENGVCFEIMIKGE